MEKEVELSNENVKPIFEEIKQLVNNSRERVYASVNTEMLNLYWNIGKIIMQLQQGNERATYGETVLEKLSEKLTDEFGKVFSIINLRRMRKFYSLFKIRSSVMNELSWTHYLELIKIDENNKRNFYLKEAINSRWSVRELQRQIASLLYERLLISKDKKEILKLSQKGQEIS